MLILTLISNLEGLVSDNLTQLHWYIHLLCVQYQGSQSPVGDEVLRTLLATREEVRNFENSKEQRRGGNLYVPELQSHQAVLQGPTVHVYTTMHEVEQEGRNLMEYWILLSRLSLHRPITPG